MPVLVPIDVMPNQELSIIIDETRFDIRLIQCFEVMAIDIKRDNEYVVQGGKCLPDSLLIPYEYAEDRKGNFFFTVVNDALPNYLKFNQSQQLWHISNAELEALRA